MNTTSDLIRQCFTAYQNNDRVLMEAILADDFTFSSPLDDNISRERYFKRCWPNSEHIEGFEIQKLLVDGEEGFVTYVCHQTGGHTVHNTEFFQCRNGKVRHVDVYFGPDSEPDDDAAEEDEDVDWDEEAVLQVMEDTVEACRAKDADRLIQHYAGDVLAFDLINPLQYEGAEEVKKRAEQWFSSFEGAIDYDLKDLMITMGGDAAFCHSLNHVVGTSTEGQKIDMWWRATVCLAKADEVWVITHLHSSVPFGMEDMKASVGLRP